VPRGVRTDIAPTRSSSVRTDVNDLLARFVGYDVLVKLKVDDLLEQEGVPMPASADGAHPPAAVTARR
jgi:hypothetical protein